MRRSIVARDVERHARAHEERDAHRAAGDDRDRGEAKGPATYAAARWRRSRQRRRLRGRSSTAWTRDLVRRHDSRARALGDAKRRRGRGAIPSEQESRAIARVPCGLIWHSRPDPRADSVLSRAVGKEEPPQRVGRPWRTTKGSISVFGSGIRVSSASQQKLRRLYASSVCRVHERRPAIRRWTRLK